MAADVVLNAGTGGDTVRSVDKAGVKTQVVALDLGGAGAENLLTTALPVTGPLTDMQLRATAVPVSGTVTASGPLTDTQLRAVAVPISGTVTANAGTNLNTSALALETTLSTLNGKVTAVNTGAVVISGALPAGAANIGDVDIVTMPAVVLAAGAAAIGSVTDGGSGKTLKSASISLTATGTVIAAVGGKRLKVYAIKLICSAALSVNWRDGAATALEGVQSIAINGGYTESVQPPAFLFGTTAGNSLDLVITGVGTAAGRVTFWDDDAS